MYGFCCGREEILERQLLIRGRAFATFSTIEIRGPYVVQVWVKVFQLLYRP